jgi:uncharacterized membrane protein
VSVRFASNLTTLLCGAFIVCASFAFGPETIGWLALGVGALVAIVIAAAFATRGRGAAQRAFDVCIFLTGVWMLVASRTFGGADLKWLTFASGAVLILVAFAGLIVHEVLLELRLSRSGAQPSDGRVGSPRERPSLGAVG